MRRSILVIAACVAGVTVRAQHPPEFQSRVDVVSVTATVTDRGGQFVMGLGKDDFAIFEDNQTPCR